MSRRAIATGMIVDAISIVIWNPASIAASAIRGCAIGAICAILASYLTTRPPKDPTP